LLLMPAGRKLGKKKKRKKNAALQHSKVMGQKRKKIM